MSEGPVAADANTAQFVEIISGAADGKSLVRIRNEKADDKIRDHIRMTPAFNRSSTTITRLTSSISKTRTAA